MPRRREKDKGRTEWEARNARMQRSVNKWAARFVPLMLFGAVGFSLWAIVVILCTNYLIHPPAGVPRRRGAGIAILVIYFLLFVPMAVSYFRVLQTIATNPGFVPRPGEGKKDSRKSDRSGQRRSDRSGGSSDGSTEEKDGYLHDGKSDGAGDERIGTPAGLDFYYKRDVFECEMDGMPRYCSTCKIWKPDRVHHSSELGKCVYKMDHYCPWAGGIISETSFKFFIQFLVYAALYCVFCLIVSAYYTAKAHAHLFRDGAPLIATIALAAIFFTFTFSMAYNSLYAVFINSTTVDNLTRRTKVYRFAVLIPNNFTPSDLTVPLPAVTAPPNAAASSSDPASSPPGSSPTKSPLHYRIRTFPPAEGSPAAQSTAEPTRTFAVLETPAGSNPYLLSTPLENFKTVMGENPIDWILPIRHSPCWDNGHTRHNHGSVDAEKGFSDRRPLMYKLGPVVDEMIAAAGLAPLQQSMAESSRLRQ